DLQDQIGLAPDVVHVGDDLGAGRGELVVGNRGADPGPASTSTWWPARLNSCTPAGLIATRYSWFFTSLGTPPHIPLPPPPAGEVDPYRLGDDAGRAEQVDEDVPPIGGQVDLLGQLTSGADEGVLVGHVQQPRGGLDQPVADRVPVLPDQRHAILVVEGDHDD